jgi:hypothetical protein
VRDVSLMEPATVIAAIGIGIALVIAWRELR